MTVGRERLTEVRYVNGVAVVSFTPFALARPGLGATDEVGALVAGGVVRIILDLTGVEILTSARIGDLLVTLRRVQDAGGQFHLVCPDNSLRDVFAITKLHRMIPVHVGVDAALRALGA